MPQELGSAQGSIRIDTSQLAQARIAVQTFAVGVERNFTGLNTASMRTQNTFAGLSTIASNLGGALGLTFGAAGVAQLGAYALAADAVATAYNRQLVAAQSLAGSQENLNSLLSAYDKATGGAIDKATALSDVTKLLAIGFADNAAELEKFATAARGISIATGQSQDYVISQLQLAIANQSTMRLDQLALGVDEVKNRILLLKNADKSLTDEMAYQNAIIGLATEKFGALAQSAEAQATGAELATKAWKDLRLELGEATGGAVGGIMQGLADELEGVSQKFRGIAEDAAKAQRAMDNLGAGPGATWLEWFVRADLKKWIELELFPGHTQVNSTGFASGGSIGPNFGNSSLRNRTSIGQVSPQSMSPYTEEQIAVIQEWATDIAAIERDAANQRTAATRQYESQRTQIIEQFETQISRQAADFASARAQQEKALADSIADIHEDAAKRVADVQADAVQRQIKAAADLADRIADAQADAARQQARAQRDLDRNIADMRADSAEREAEQAEKLEESIADARATSAERVAKLEADYAAQRERAAVEHGDRILDATARLDANAIYTAQRDYARSLKAAEQGHREQLTEEQTSLQESLDQINQSYAERLADERAALQESIDDAKRAHQRQRADAQEALALRLADEREAYAERLEEAKAADAERLEEAALADAERIEDLKTAHTDQKREQDAEYALRLSRQKEDHGKQLAAMATAHSDRMSQIAEQERTLKTERQNAFLAQLKDFDLFHDEFLKRQQKLQEDQLKLFDAWWEAMGKRFVRGTAPSLANPHGGMQTPPNQPMVIPDGIGPAPQTDIYAPGGGAMPINPHANTSSISSSRTGGNVTVNLTVNGAPGQSEQALGDIIERKIVDIARKVSQPL